jgi:glycosyltransferase involved in cell wall biosynthesis
LTQGIDDLRVLIVDNASADDSVEVARGLAEQDSRIEIVARKTNLGPHASWNDGIDWARSDYLLILCADDLLAPGARGDLVRRNSIATALFRLAFRLSPTAALVPPVNDLLRMERPASRISRIIRKAAISH